MRKNYNNVLKLALQIFTYYGNIKKNKKKKGDFMKKFNFKKLLKTILTFALVFIMFTPITANAYSDTIPNWTIDWDLEGLSILEDGITVGRNKTCYSICMFEPYNSALTLKINAQSNVPSNVKIKIECYNSMDNLVGTKYVSCTNNQYITFDNLNDRSHYFKFSGGSSLDYVPARYYISKNNLFY